MSQQQDLHEIIQRLTKENAEQFAQLQDFQRGNAAVDSLHKLIKQQEETIQARDAQLQRILMRQSELEDVDQEREIIQNNHKEEIAKLKGLHQHKMEDLKIKHEQNIANAIQKRKADLQAKDEEIDELKSSNQDAIQCMVTPLHDEIQNLRNQLSDKEDLHQKKIEHLQEMIRSGEVKKLIEKIDQKNQTINIMSSQISAMKKEHEEMLQQHRQQMLDISQHYGQQGWEWHSLNTDLKKKLDERNNADPTIDRKLAELDKKLREADDAKLTLHNTIQHWRGQLDKLTVYHGEKDERIARLLQTELDIAVGDRDIDAVNEWLSYKKDYKTLDDRRAINLLQSLHPHKRPVGPGYVYPNYAKDASIPKKHLEHEFHRRVVWAIAMYHPTRLTEAIQFGLDPDFMFRQKGQVDESIPYDYKFPAIDQVNPVIESTGFDPAIHKNETHLKFNIDAELANTIMHRYGVDPKSHYDWNNGLPRPDNASFDRYGIDSFNQQEVQTAIFRVDLPLKENITEGLDVSAAVNVLDGMYSEKNKTKRSRQWDMELVYLTEAKEFAEKKGLHTLWLVERQLNNLLVQIEKDPLGVIEPPSWSGDQWSIPVPKDGEAIIVSNDAAVVEAVLNTVSIPPPEEEADPALVKGTRAPASTPHMQSAGVSVSDQVVQQVNQIQLVENVVRTISKSKGKGKPPPIPVDYSYIGEAEAKSPPAGTRAPAATPEFSSARPSSSSSSAPARSKSKGKGLPPPVPK